MMKLLEKMIGIDLPHPDEIVENQLAKQHAILQHQLAEQKKLEASIVHDTLPKGSIAQVKVALFKDNNCSVIIELEQEANSQEEADAIARMLYTLNEGGMKSTIANIIMRQTSSNINDTEFGKKIMSAWEKQYKESDKDCISPSQVFTME